MIQKTALTLCCWLITLAAILNLIRFFWNIPVTIDAVITLPGWTGAPLFFLLGLLSIWSFRELFAFARSSPLSHH